jgi:hypothetical protein
MTFPATEAQMSQDLRVCFTECCHWINNKQVNESEFEQAVVTADPVHHNPIVMKVRCPKALSPASDTIEKRLGFYIGIHSRRTGTTLPDGRNPPIFEKATDQCRGDATDLDLQQWQQAHKDLPQAGLAGDSIAGNK